MANYTAQVAKSQTLGAAAVDQVTLAQFGNQLRVMNRSATATDIIWFTVGSVNNPPAAPTVAGDDCYACPASTAGVLVPWPASAGGTTPGVVVKLISATTPAYTIQLSGDR